MDLRRRDDVMSRRLRLAPLRQSQYFASILPRAGIWQDGTSIPSYLPVPYSSTRHPQTLIRRLTTHTRGGFSASLYFMGGYPS